MRNTRIILLLALSMGAWSPAHAQLGCGFVTAGTLVNFGSYPNFTNPANPVDGTGTITVLCTVLANYTLTIGRGSSSGFNPRTLQFSGYTLNYNLYKDANRTQIWGDGTAGTSGVNQLCLLSCSHTVYGRIFGGQSGVQGIYQDSVLVTVTF